MVCMVTYANNEFIALYFRDAAASNQRLRRIGEELERITKYRVVDMWRSPAGHLGLINLSEAGSSPADGLAAPAESSWSAGQLRPNRLRVRHQRAFLQAGYITTPQASWEREVRIDSELRCEDAGGIAAFCAASFSGEDNERLFLWSTRPGLRSIAFGESSELIVAGTRPRLVARILQDFGRARLDTSYVLSSLVGWSLDDRTPYEGVTLIAVDEMLCVSDGRCKTSRVPTPPFERRAFSPLALETLRYRHALRRAVQPLSEVDGFELRLSGGKDSRLVAAALHESGIVPSTAICHGIPGEWETPVAERVAKALGWSIHFPVPEFGSLGGMLATVRQNLTLADGFLATEPLQAPYPSYGISGERGHGLVLGHIELQRGGWASSLKVSLDDALAYARRRVTPQAKCCVPPLAKAAQNLVQDYAGTLKLRVDAEYLYWINYRFRVCRWLTSHYLLHSNELLPVYPLLDERVVRLVSSVPLGHLTSERLAFATTVALAPALRSVPLFRDRYRFEKKLPNWRFARGYSARKPVQPAPSTYLKREVVLKADVARPLCEHIRNGALRHELREATSKAVWAYIESPSGDRMKESGVERKTLASYLWTCFQASVLHTEGLAEERTVSQRPPERLINRPA